MNKVVIILSEGFEEIEAITTIDILRRGNCLVEVMGVDNVKITGAHGITIQCDDVFDSYACSDYDGIVLVGGMKNAINLSENEAVINVLKDFVKRGKLVAGICATPALVFSKAGILSGMQATCYPDSDFINRLGCEFVDKSVVVSDNIITSQSPKTSMEFALAILENLGYDIDTLRNNL